MHVYKHNVKDISELRERIVTAWDEVDQCIIDTAVGQWHTRLRACVKALGGHFEHKLCLIDVIAKYRDINRNAY